MPDRVTLPAALRVPLNRSRGKRSDLKLMSARGERRATSIECLDKPGNLLSERPGARLSGSGENGAEIR